MFIQAKKAASSRCIAPNCEPGKKEIEKFITSSSISLIEGAVMNASTNGTFSSITMDIINAYLSNSTSLKVFLENGSLIEENGNEFLIVDPETGIVRDINTSTNACGIAKNWEGHER